MAAGMPDGARQGTLWGAVLQAWGVTDASGVPTRAVLQARRGAAAAATLCCLLQYSLCCGLCWR